MAEQEGKKTESGGKGFYRFSGLLDFFKPNAETKPKAKKDLYRYSPPEFGSPKTGETPGSPSKRADREPRNSEGILSPKKKRQPVHHHHRHSDLKAGFERCTCQVVRGQLPKLRKETRKRSAVTSPERKIPSPITSPARSPPSAGNRREKKSKCAVTPRKRIQSPITTLSLSPPSPDKRRDKKSKWAVTSPERRFQSPIRTPALSPPFASKHGDKMSRSAVTSPERRFRSPIKSPPLSPPSAAKLRDKMSNCNEKLHLLNRDSGMLNPKIKATAASSPLYLRNDHMAATPKVGSTPLSPQRMIPSPASVPPQRASHAGERMPDDISPLLQRGKIFRDPEVEGIAPMPAPGLVEERLPEVQNVNQLEDNQSERCGGFCNDLPWILLSLLLAAIVTAMLVGHMTAEADSFKESTANDHDVDDYDDLNRPFVLVGGGRSLPFPTGTAEERNIRTHVCVYNGRQEGLTYEEDGMAYSAGTMPLGSCNLVLYCCAQLNYGYSPLQEAGDVGNFERLWNVTASIRPWQRPMLIIGDSGDDELGRFRDILRYRHAKETFVAATANWCLRQGYAGVFLQWPQEVGFALDDVLPVMVELQQLFLARSLTLGTVVPQDEIEANWTHLHELATALGEASIILKPPVYTSRHFTHWTCSYYMHDLLEKLNSTAQRMGPARNSLCFMAPAEAVAFTVNISVVPENLEHMPALGPAMSTRHSAAGHRSYTEVCSAIANMTVRVSSHAVLAIGNGLWLSLTTQDRLGHFFDEVRTIGYTCGGIWDSEKDDFTGVCESEPYPLMAATKAQFFDPPGRVASKQP